MNPVCDLTWLQAWYTVWCDGDWEHGRSGRYDYDDYRRHGCRLAVAPTHWGDGDDYRYVRVCPDDRGNYRIAD